MVLSSLVVWKHMRLHHHSKPFSLKYMPTLLQDPPEEFVDALMDTLMEDPVTLPTSKQVIDRSTISR